MIKEVKNDPSNVYEFLNNLGVQNIVYPKINDEERFITQIENKYYYVTDYYRINDNNTNKKASDMFEELIKLHRITSFPKKMSPELYRSKFDELSKRIDYHFKIIEEYIRSLENQIINQNTFKILENYYIILDMKQELAKLQRKIINSIKENLSIDYVFVHNNPKLEHLIYVRGNKFLVSVENGKMGICSLDFAKFYIENSDVDIDLVGLIKNELQNKNSTFYYNYFRFNVLLILFFNININYDINVTSNTFVINAKKIQRFINDFEDIEQTN